MNILLVEDSPLLRDRLRSLISAIPNAILVEEIDNEDAAKCYLEEFRPELAIIDLCLRSGSGLAVIGHIQAMHLKTTVIVLTNFVQPEYQAKCMKLGAHYFFDKSKDTHAFIDLLADLSKRRTEPIDTSRIDKA